MDRKKENDRYTITLSESQLIFDNVGNLREYLINRYGFNDREIGIIFVCSLNSLNQSLLIDIIYETYRNLMCVEKKDTIMIELYNKVLKIINYHIAHNNFKDNNSIFMKEFEHALLNYDQISMGVNIDKSVINKR